MSNNYNKFLALVFLALVALPSHALQYRNDASNDYFVWMYYTIADSDYKALSRGDTPHFWNSGEPNNSSNNEHCATQAYNGGWNDLNCNNSRRLACFNGANWALSVGTVNLNSYSSTALPPGCPAGYKFAAPINQTQKDALNAVIPSSITDGVWINAFDNNKGMNTEGIWVLNRGATELFGPNWKADEPAKTKSKQCAAVDNAGQWVAADCNTSYPLVCATQNFGQVKVVGNSRYSNNLQDMHDICRTQGAAVANGESNQWWQLAAPRTKSENDAVQSTLQADGVSSAWVNATGNHQFGTTNSPTWQYNLSLTNWANGQPNFGSNNEKQCVVARQSDGKWEMVDCDSRAYILCSDGDEWVVRKATHQFSNQAFEACSRPNTATNAANPFINHQLKTPVTEADRKKANDAIRGTDAGQKVWLNMKYIRDTQKWYVNESYATLEFAAGNPQVQVWYNIFQDGSNKDTVANVIDYYTGSSLPSAVAYEHNFGIPTYFAHEEPNGSGNSAGAKGEGTEKNHRKSCIQLAAKDFDWAKKGQWDDTDCGLNRYVACSDGFEWRISPIMANFGNNIDATENISNGHNACALVEKNGVTGNFRFAAPASFAESQSLLTAASSAGVDRVWINMHAKKTWRAFVINQGATFQAPFWNDGEPNNFGAGENCAVQQKDAGWNDIGCNAAFPVACYDPFDGLNGTWKISANSHAYKDNGVNSAESVEHFNQLCQTEFGSRYKFYAPVTLSHQRDLKVAMGSHGDVHINANDIDVEDSWRFNMHINNWAPSQPSTSTNERCVSANAETSWWYSRNCVEELPVACSSGARWYFTEGKVTLSEFANGEKACFNEFGPGYSFAAPRTLDDALQLQYFAKIEGLGGNFWINGNRMEDFNKWVWNAQRLSTPVWGYGNQPDGGTRENCAVINNNNEGSWDDERCGSNNFAYLCRNGNNWQVTSATGNLSDFSVAVTACAALGPGWNFAAPTTYNENLAAKNAMAGHAKVWVNATDAVSEGTWLLNSAPINSYPLWGNTDTGSCLYQDDQGQVSSIECLGAAEKPWACTDGYNWKVTKSQGRIQKFVDGHKACLREYGASYVFAAPLNMNDSIQLDFARLQAANDRNEAISSLWLNMTTVVASNFISNNGRAFRRNLPFTNWRDFDAGEDPLPTVCAFKGAPSSEGANNPWRTQSCTANAAHYACTDGDSWRIAHSKGELMGSNIQLVPQVGEDYWSYERGNALCKEQHGASYFFSAPVTAAEDLALDTAIRRSPANVKNVWLNYYPINALSGTFISEYGTGDIVRGDGLWFANRIKLGIWQKPKFNNMNNADCALLHKDGSTTTYLDGSCSNNANLEGNESHPFACFNGVEWQVTGNGYWQNGFDTCANASNSMFAAPRTPDELEDLVAEIPASGKVWINMNDTASEGQWIANRLQYSWWAESEPRNDFNKDCAQIKATDGKWVAARCSIEVAPFVCRITTRGSNATTAWRLTETEGFWSEGFAACVKEFSEEALSMNGKVEFAAPQGYGTTSASQEQAALESIGLTKNAWLNLSDQEVEGAWRAHRAYSNWGTDSLFDEAKDCAYIDSAVQVRPGQGNWFADQCKYTASNDSNRGYACTNGTQWKVLEVEPTANLQWSKGFLECEAAFGEGWTFAAPTNALEDRQVNIAMKLAGVSQLWINAHDRIKEGDWQINGLETNFPPEIDVSATAVVVKEQQTNIQLHAVLTDEEETGINTDPSKTKWELVSNRSVNALETDPDATDISVTGLNITPNTHGNGSATLTAQYSTPVLFKEDRLLTFKVTATDLGSGSRPAATSEVYVNVRVAAPLIAAYDFESNSRPNQDITGHGHDILANTMGTAQVVSETTNAIQGNALKLVPTSKLVVRGKGSDPANGIEFSAAEYTIAFRISVEENINQWRGILGVDGRAPLVALFPEDNKLHTSTLKEGGGHKDVNTNAPILDKQWVNVVLVKTANNKFHYYIDNQLVRDASFDDIPVESDGDLFIGHVPGTHQSFTGLLDDIYIFNRELSVNEIQQILPTPPVGEISFVEASAVVDEYDENNPDHSYAIQVERTRGSVEELTVYVDYDLSKSVATRGEPSDMDTAADQADFAFADTYVDNKGVAVTWAAGERGVKTVDLILDKADDGIREGTETAVFELAQLGEPADARVKQGTNKAFTLYINDLTPNPYGAFSVGIKNGTALESQKLVNATSTDIQEICFRRDTGSVATAQGEVTVHYTVGGNAVSKDDNPADYDYEVINDPSSSPGVVTFADGQKGDQCLTLNVNKSGGDENHLLSVTIQSIQSNDPVVAAEILLVDGMTQAQLTILNFENGVFSFSDSSFKCYEEVSTEINSKVVDWAQRPAGSICEVTVVRSGTGQNAEAAELTLKLGSNTHGLTDRILSWPALDAGNPATPSTEQRVATFSISANNVQNSDEVVELTLEPTDGEIVNVASNYPSQLYVQDVTTPELIIVSRTTAAEVNEGQPVKFSVERATGTDRNPNTYFNVGYEVVVERISTNETLPVNNYVSSLKVGGANQSFEGSVFFAVGENSKEFELTTINTPANDPDIRVILKLKDAARPSADLRPTGLGRDDVVAISQLANAGTGTDNKGEAEATVKNTRDLIANNLTVVIRDLGGDGSARPVQTFGPATGSTVNAGNFLAVKKAQVPDTREIELELQVPAGLHADDANYTWRLLNAAGTAVATWDDGVTPVANTSGNARIYQNRTGSLGYASGGSAVTVKSKVKLPFVTGIAGNVEPAYGWSIAPSAFKLELAINGNTETFTKLFDLTVEPVYRRLQNRANSRCIRAWGDTFVGCGDTKQWSDIYWAWNPETNYMINLKEHALNNVNKCIDIPSTSGLGTTNARLRACDPVSGATGNRKATFNTGENFLIDGTTVCRYLLSSTKIMRKSGCSDNNDIKFIWQD